MSAKGSSGTCNSKPMNINISFTINPKNMLSKQSESSDNGFKMKKSVISEIQTFKMERKVVQYKAKTPDIPFTDRIQFQKEFNDYDKKQKHSKKRNSIDESFLYGLNKKDESMNLQKFQQSFHFRKTSLKAKKQSDSVIKRKHNKTVSKHSTCDNSNLKNTIVQSLSNEQRTNYKKNLKNMINSMMKNQFSKSSLPIAMPTQQLKTARKKKIGNRKELKAGESEYILSRKNNEEDNFCIEKFASIRSMNNSIFKSEQDEEFRPKSRRTIDINTDQSIDCINEIHDIQKANMEFRKRDFENLNENIEGNYEDTKNLIKNMLINLNNQSEISEEVEERVSNKKLQKSSGSSRERQSFKKDKKVEVMQTYQKGGSFRDTKVKEKDGDFHIPFCPSQMSKQQKMINEIERVKLRKLKKHEVLKWGELLTFIKKSMNEGKVDYDEILMEIYRFLEQTKLDLQKEINMPQGQKGDFEEFTDKNFSNQFKPDEDKLQICFEGSQSIISNKQKDEKGDQNEQLKFMNLSMISNALKQRHDSIIQKMNRDFVVLEEKRNLGEILEGQFMRQRQRLERLVRKQCGEIMDARRNIWKGYNEAKGIIDRSQKSLGFLQESLKKKKMMKCLSQDYLMKSYKYKKLEKKEVNQGSSGSSEYDYDYVNDGILERKQVFHKPLNCSSQNEEEEGSQEQEEVTGLDRNDNDEDSVLNKENDEILFDRDVEDVNGYGLGVVIENRRKRYLLNEQQNFGQKQQQRQLLELQQLSKQDDFNQLKKKLQDIKERHFNEDDEEIDREDQERSVCSDEMRVVGQKLRGMSDEDREDIFEFIFLDLSIEIYQQVCYGNRIMESINEYVKGMKKQANRRKGIKTNLNVVKQYLKRFIGYILRVHKGVLESLDEPVGPSALEMLRYMHGGDDRVDGEDENGVGLVIPCYVFELFESNFVGSMEFQRYYDDEDRENVRVQFLRDLIHIHNKAIFDAMNENLDMLRPWGIWGKPFAWKSSCKFGHRSSDGQKQQKLWRVNERIIENCSYVCGLLVDKQDSLVGYVKVSQEYVNRIKQDRVSRMLARELIQNQQRWLFYDDQETQVLVEMSVFVDRVLMEEFGDELISILGCR